MQTNTKPISYPHNPLPRGGLCPCSSCERRRMSWTAQQFKVGAL
jgi:hypothetical protein